MIDIHTISAKLILVVRYNYKTNRLGLGFSRGWAQSRHNCDMVISALVEIRFPP